MDLRKTFDRLTDAWNAHDVDGFVAPFAEDCELTLPGFDAKGRQGLRDFWAENEKAFPDNQVVVHRTYVDGDTVVEESLFRGTNTGPLGNPDGTETPPTGARIEVPFAAVYTVRGHEIVRVRMYWDQLDMLAQLGLLPE
ncbi:ester cyclase [Pseudonocardia halophobica]|uniref:ester cyclase n=1 Tax=Pseudonocardia halophobica TaxID=29401 RepID=UPI003D8F53CA